MIRDGHITVLTNFDMYLTKRLVMPTAKVPCAKKEFAICFCLNPPKHRDLKKRIFFLLWRTCERILLKIKMRRDSTASTWN